MYVFFYFLCMSLYHCYFHHCVITAQKNPYSSHLQIIENRDIWLQRKDKWDLCSRYQYLFQIHILCRIMLNMQVKSHKCKNHYFLVFIKTKLGKSTYINPIFQMKIQSQYTSKATHLCIHARIAHMNIPICIRYINPIAKQSKFHYCIFINDSITILKYKTN